MTAERMTTAEYETLQASGREVAGNRERATVADVVVGESTVRIVLSFDWKTETERVTFDLDSEREVLQLKTLARAHGYGYDQLPYLEDETVEVVYLDGRWHPAETLPDVGSNVLTDVAPESGSGAPGRLTRAYEDLLGRIEEVTGRDVILAVIVVKKILVSAAIVYLVVANLA